MKHALMWLALFTASIAHAGEDLVPIVVAAVDIPAGTKVTMELISQRSIPKRLVTLSLVKPDSASYIIDQPITRPMLAGDLMAWNNFEVADKRAVAECQTKFAASEKNPSAAQQVHRARAAIIKR